MIPLEKHFTRGKIGHLKQLYNIEFVEQAQALTDDQLKKARNVGLIFIQKLRNIRPEQPIDVRIKSYPIDMGSPREDGAVYTLQMHQDAKILTVFHSHPHRIVFITVSNTTKPLVERSFMVFQTGENIDMYGLQFIGTVNNYLLHIFEKKI